ncbi:MAG TPA: hypothetical protein PLT65_04290 [Bacilli bacterium]|nr:hypothetical protein [Bacilli bacterium]
MTVICSKCKKECKNYEFRNIGNDILPVCIDCIGREKVMKTLIEVHEERLERAWNGKDVKLDGWFK